ncbi:hypothetical protein GALL_531160 [mine drainage metagenome]|uniref:Uncharacterized protein n=1 Tax=mine drainage metagenome TaxID=410659 RepID=A0A1J5PBZ5_9ZZZZ
MPAAVSAAASNAPAVALPATSNTLPVPAAVDAGASTAEAKVGPAVLKPVRVKHPRVKKKPLATKKLPHQRPAPVASLAQPEPQAAVAGKTVLRLEPLTALPSRAGAASAAAAVPASAAASAPELALAAVDALLQTKKIEALESEIKALKALVAKNNQNLADVRDHLAQAESERIPALLFYLVLGLLMCCMALLAWVVWQNRRGPAPQSHWWQRGEDRLPQTVFAAPQSAMESRQEPAVTVLAPATPLVPAAPAPDLAQQPEVDLDIDLDNLAMADTQLPEPEPTPAAPAPTPETAPAVAPEPPVTSAAGPDTVIIDHLDAPLTFQDDLPEMTLTPLPDAAPAEIKPAPAAAMSMLDLDFSSFTTEADLASPAEKLPKPG